MSGAPGNGFSVFFRFGAAKAAESVQNQKGCDIAVKFENENMPRKRLTFVKEITKIVNNLKLNKS